MNAPRAFSGGEWKAVLDGPVFAGLAVIAAAPSGFVGLLAERRALDRVIRACLRQPTHSALLAALAQDFEGRSLPGAAELRRQDFDALYSQAIQGLRLALSLVHERTEAAEAQAYGALLLEAARRTARAALEGNVLDLDATWVNGAERTALQIIETLVARGHQDLDRVLSPDEALDIVAPLLTRSELGLSE